MTSSPVSKKETPLETLRSIVLAVLLAVLFRSFAFEPFHIPSGSMKGTLLVGDYVFVSKFAYGYSAHSLPFSAPLISGRIFAKPIERGDVVVFRLPSDPSISYVKRVIGLPGDRIQMISGVLYLNGEAIPKTRIADFQDENPDGSTKAIPHYEETLPNGVRYQVLDEQAAGPLDSTGMYVVPVGHYFMMGDNRDNSTDSRVLDRVGYVSELLIEGRAERIFFSATAPLWQVWRLGHLFRGDRFFAPVHSPFFSHAQE